MSDPYASALFLDEPGTLAILGMAEGSAAEEHRPVVFIRVNFEVEGFGSFTAGGFNTLQGATGATFQGGRLIPLKARSEPGHRFSHWEFRKGEGKPVFGGSNFLANVLPSLGLVIKATFLAATAASDPAVSETETLTDVEGLSSAQAGPEVFAPAAEESWSGVEGPSPAAVSRGAKILCKSAVGSLPKPVCRDKPQRMETTHEVTIENATDFPVEGTLVGRLEIPGFSVTSEKKEKVRVAPRTNKTFTVNNAGTLRPNKTGSFSLGAITRFEGPAATPAAAARGFEVKDC